MATLKLTLKKKAYEVMATGEKKEEYRRNCKWIRSRLDRTNKPPLKWVQFTNGYRKDSPSFTVEYLGWDILKDIDVTYSNGLSVKMAEGVRIKLGGIVATA